MILDFKEIPEANRGGGLQDTFELFTRDFLQYLGYKIVSNPDRGADGKKDLIVEEIVNGIAYQGAIRWLVSCKHFAHSGTAVADRDEISINDRLEQHDCDGFMGVYSTIPSSSLSGMLKGVKKYMVFDHEKIEGILLRDSDGQHLAARYFPKSYASFRIENPVPANIFSDAKTICCEVCGADLLNGSKRGNYICLTPFDSIDENGSVVESDNQIMEIHFACKGNCEKNINFIFVTSGMILMI